MQTVNLTVIGNKIDLNKISNNYEKLKFYKKNFKLNCEEFEQPTQVEKFELQIIDNLQNYGIYDKRIKKIGEAVSVSEFIGFLLEQEGLWGRLETPPFSKQSNKITAASISSPLINIQKKSSNLYQEHYDNYYQQLNDVINNSELMSLSSSRSTTLSSSSSSSSIQ